MIIFDFIFWQSQMGKRNLSTHHAQGTLIYAYNGAVLKIQTKFQ